MVDFVVYVSRIHQYCISQLMNNCISHSQLVCLCICIVLVVVVLTNMIIDYCRASMFLQGSDLLRACNGTRSNSMALFFAIPERREEFCMPAVRLTQDKYLPYFLIVVKHEKNKMSIPRGKMSGKKM